MEESSKYFTLRLLVNKIFFPSCYTRKFQKKKNCELSSIDYLYCYHLYFRLHIPFPIKTSQSSLEKWLVAFWGRRGAKLCLEYGICLKAKKLSKTSEVTLENTDANVKVLPLANNGTVGWSINQRITTMK